jgi:hypothetical protein
VNDFFSLAEKRKVREKAVSNQHSAVREKAVSRQHSAISYLDAELGWD